MSTGTRVLVLLTDGNDLGSKSTQSEAIAAADRADVTVYAIAAGPRSDTRALAALAGATGGRVFDVADTARLDATYRSLARELRRTWQLSYLSTARQGDRLTLAVQAAGATAKTPVRIPGSAPSGLFPSAVAGNPITAAVVVLLAALLLAGAAAAGRGRRRSSELSRLLEPHVTLRDIAERDQQPTARLESLFAWTERSLTGLPGSERLARVAGALGPGAARRPHSRISRVLPPSSSASSARSRAPRRRLPCC